MSKRITLNELIGRGPVESQTFSAQAAERARLPQQNVFADETGVHVYGELRLTLNLSAAEETKDAQRYLQILQEYAGVAACFAEKVGAQLLEVQGERIHLLLPCMVPDANSVTKLLGMCASLARVMYARIQSRAGDAWQGFAMAADHGRAILIKSGDGASGSLVSLGPAANAPAKQLSRTPARHLSLRQPLKALVGAGTDTGWMTIDLVELPEYLEKYADRVFTDDLTTAASAIVESFRAASVITANEQYFDVSHTTSVEQPLKVQVICLRADLDGFSAAVQAAFSDGEPAIRVLVDQFFGVMRYVEQYCASIKRKVISLPWAGDCSNHLFFPLMGESYETARQYLPATAAAEWHDQISEKVFGKVTWAVGVAGGDSEEGSNGFVLVAPIKTGQRDFLVAAGWGVKRSLDAQEADGVKGKDSVIPVEDYGALDSVWQDQFRELDSRFWISRGLSMSKIRNATIESAKRTPEIYVPQVARPVPSPRPHWNHERA